jgi:hypothetical protein
MIRCLVPTDHRRPGTQSGRINATPADLLQAVATRPRYTVRRMENDGHQPDARLRVV